MSNNSKLVDEIIIFNGDASIFDLSEEYVIPLYQRAYAWSERQIVQLIEDIEDVEIGKKYYLGSLVVSRQNDYFEVIDGQQRLTTLFLLLNALGVKTNTSISFECRDKSNYTLKNIHSLLDGKFGVIDHEKIQPEIEKGLLVIKDRLREVKDTAAFLQKLGSVILYRIDVPPYTDLNRYFEIMNTRGEQLEQHDILKARFESCRREF